MDGKRLDDRAEGLWRIHDELYDLTDFIGRHPGGESWLRLTKGTDITEAFEAHHLTNGPRSMLPKFRVRSAAKPRLYRFTFKENGFYMTLKEKVVERLKTVDKSGAKSTKLILDSLLALTFVLAIATAKLNSFVLAFITGLFMCWTIISSHNFFHQRDNWRMMVFNIGFFSYKEWRISHAMSHHIYTNSLYDLEMSLFEPFFVWVPNSDVKTAFQKYGSWIYSPVIYSSLFFQSYIKRAFQTVATAKIHFQTDDLIPFTVPVIMLVFTSSQLFVVLKLWIFILVSASFCFGVIGLNAAHHHDQTIHDGDHLNDDMDWGLYQLDAVMDRSDLKGSLFLELTHFGNHALHHLFPTVDHALLEEFNDVFYETCREFETHLVEKPWFHHIRGQLLQLARTEAHAKTRVERTACLMK